jgi:hypothetical protein
MNTLRRESAYMGLFLVQLHLSIPIREALRLDARLVSAMLPSLREESRLDVKLLALCYNMLLCNQNRSGAAITGIIPSFGP